MDSPDTILQFFFCFFGFPVDLGRFAVLNEFYFITSLLANQGFFCIENLKNENA